MGRHSPASAATASAGAPRLARVATLTVVWLAGLASGLFGLLGASAKFTTCSAHATTFACSGAGASLGVVLVIGVIAIVTAASVLSYGRERQEVLAVGAGSVLVLIGLLLAARALLATA